MKVVLDTNVIISGLLWKSKTKALFDLADQKRITICLTAKIIAEVAKVLEYPKIKKQLNRANLTTDEIISYLLQISQFFSGVSLKIKLTDSSDKIFLEAAYDSGAKYLITGDKHLLILKNFRSIKILKPEEFLNEIKQG